MATIPQSAPPFDMGAPAPDLPEGSSNLPWFNQLPETQTREVDVNVEPNDSWLSQIRAYPADQQTLMLTWWSRSWNRPSQYLDGKHVLSLPGLLMHIEKAAKVEAKEQRANKSQAVGTFAAEYTEWTKQCGMRLAWIESKSDAWRKRMAERAAAMVQWDAYVEEARNEYKMAKVVPVPTRPKRI